MPNPNNTRRFWLQLAAFMAAATVAVATGLPAWDIEMLTRASDLVVRGTVAEQTQGELDGRLITLTGIDVDQVLYRNEKRLAQPPGARVVLTQWGGHSRTVSTRVGGDATLETGQSVLLFLFRGPIGLETLRKPPEKGQRPAPLLFITQLGVGAFVIDGQGDLFQSVDADLISQSDGSVQPRPAERRFAFEEAIAQIEAGQHPPGEAPLDKEETPDVDATDRSAGEDTVLLPLAEIQRAQAEAAKKLEKKPGPGALPSPLESAPPTP